MVGCYMTRPLFRRIPLVKRIYPSLLKKWASVTWTGGYKIKEYEGLHFLLSYRNFVDRHIAFFGFERPQRDYLLQHMRTNGCDCFLDIGANIGLYALTVAHSGLVPEIHAFEPDPRNYAQFLGNLYLNHMTGRIHPHQLALSDKTGELRFHLSPDASTGHTRVANADEDAVVFKAERLDHVLPVQGKKVFMKIDVEGHELAVLQGGASFLRDNDCFMQIEIWPENLEVVTAYLSAAGYRQVHRIEQDSYFRRF